MAKKNRLRQSRQSERLGTNHLRVQDHHWITRLTGKRVEPQQGLLFSPKQLSRHFKSSLNVNSIGTLQKSKQQKAVVRGTAIASSYTLTIVADKTRSWNGKDNREHFWNSLYPIERSSLFLLLTRWSNANGSTATSTKFSQLVQIIMSAHHLSSLKWSDEGELSPQDTWNLVTKLTKTEDQSKASNLLHLSSKHSHAKSKKTHKNWTQINSIGPSPTRAH